MSEAKNRAHVRAQVVRYMGWKDRVVRRLKNRKVNTSYVPHRLYSELYDKGLSPADAAKEISRTDWTPVR